MSLLHWKVLEAAQQCLLAEQRALLGKRTTENSFIPSTLLLREFDFAKTTLAIAKIISVGHPVPIHTSTRTKIAGGGR